MAKKKIGVLLAGCGVKDGSEIHEATLTLYFLDMKGAEIVCMAPDKDQMDVVNHVTGKATGEKRNALVEAARIDGCGHLGIWWRIMLPLCKPVIAITAVFTFIGTWNDFLGPLIYLQSEDQMTLAVALNSFQNQYGDFSDMNLLMAASVVTMIPCVVLFFVAQKQFVGGLQLGAVKG